MDCAAHCTGFACVRCSVQAIYHGKPIVAMPFFADQLTNADKVVAKVRMEQDDFEWLIATCDQNWA